MAPNAQLYVIRILAAAMEKTARGGGSSSSGPGESDHAGVILFVLKVELCAHACNCSRHQPTRTFVDLPD